MLTRSAEVGGQRVAAEADSVTAVRVVSGAAVAIENKIRYILS